VDSEHLTPRGDMLSNNSVRLLSLVFLKSEKEVNKPRTTHVPKNDHTQKQTTTTISTTPTLFKTAAV